MSIACKTLVHASLSSRAAAAASAAALALPFSSLSLRGFSSFLSPTSGLALKRNKAPVRRYGCAGAAIPVEIAIPEAPEEGLKRDTVEQLLINPKNDVSRLMKMERKLEPECSNERKQHWFPYLDRFTVLNGEYLSSEQVLEALDPYITDTRKERLKNVVKNRSYSVCLVVEGLSDFGNVSAAFRSADAMGIQSVHVVSCDSSKRCKLT